MEVGFGGGGFEGDEFGDLVGMECAKPVECGEGGGSGGFDDDEDLGGGFDGSLPCVDGDDAWEDLDAGGEVFGDERGGGGLGGGGVRKRGEEEAEGRGGHGMAGG